MVKTRSFYFN